jgi:F0F1-type ATP synthase membrane subunit b/b'
MGVAHNGVEMSLPKIFGAMVMFALVYTLLARFVFPQALNWLKGRAAIGHPQLS